MRYFFHIRTEDGLIPDEEGTDLCPPSGPMRQKRGFS